MTNLPATKKDLSILQENFLEVLFDPTVAGDIRKAMTAAGYSENTAIKEVVGPLQEQILERTNSYLSLHGPKAATGIVDIISNPSTVGAANKLKAAESVLDRIGIIKKNDDAMKLPQGSIVFLPPKEKVTISISTDSEPKIKTIDG